MEETGVCEASLALWGLEVGAITSAASLCGTKEHGVCPKGPSLEILCFEDQVGFALVGFLVIHSRDLRQAQESGWVCAHP